MRYVDIMEEAETPYERRRAEMLAQLIADWIGIDPFYTSNHAQQKFKLAQQILQYDDIAMHFRRVPQLVLYRGIGLRRPKFINGFLVVEPRKTDLLESWTTDETFAYEHAGQYPRGFVIEERTASLTVFIDVWMFMAALGEDWTHEGEVIVRSERRAYGRVQNADD